jgi:MFS transporter, MHS family, proline/betaine transporter
VLGGGAGPYAATWLIDQTGNNLMPAFLLVGFGLIGLVVVGLTVRFNNTNAHLYR